MLTCSRARADYVLSDPGRRRAYDAQRSSRSSSSRPSGSTSAGGFPGGFADFAGFDNSDSASANFFSQFFGKGGAGAQYADEDTQSSFGSGSESSGTGARPNADHVFGDVFEELLTPEVERVVPFWKWVGAASGAALGFVIGNLPGAVSVLLMNRLWPAAPPQPGFCSGIRMPTQTAVILLTSHFLHFLGNWDVCRREGRKHQRREGQGKTTCAFHEILVTSVTRLSQLSSWS